MKKIRVSAAIFEDGDKVLIARRKAEKSLALHWEFPGGKIEKDETPEIALIREIQEEMRITIEIQSYFATHIHKYDSVEVELICFKVYTNDRILNSTDHDKIEWIHPSDHIKFKMAPADIPIMERL